MTIRAGVGARIPHPTTNHHLFQGQTTRDGGPDALRVLRIFLGARHEDTFLKAIPSRTAVVGLISLGPCGADVLFDALLDRGDNGTRYRSGIVDTLWAVAQGRPLPWAPLAPRISAVDAVSFSPEARAAAAQCLRDVVAEVVLDLGLFMAVTQAMWMSSLVEDGEVSETGRGLLELLVDSSIRLSRSLISDYSELISTSDREEAYQRFLAENPVFLDPLAGLVIPKQRLGLEFATDYAVQRFDGRWLLVEIEKPSTPIMTQGYDFTSEFTHGFGQVVDFQHWVDDNVAYAQRHMPQITSPRGLLVIGRRSALDERAQAKFRAFAENSARISVVTFDDLLTAAENLYSNLRKRAIGPHTG